MYCLPFHNASLGLNRSFSVAARDITSKVQISELSGDVRQSFSLAVNIVPLAGIRDLGFSAFASALLRDRHFFRPKFFESHWNVEHWPEGTVDVRTVEPKSVRALDRAVPLALAWKELDALFKSAGELDHWKGRCSICNLLLQESLLTVVLAEFLVLAQNLFQGSQ